MVRELERYRWDAVLLNETWRPAKSEIWETHQRHSFTGAGKYEIKHGVGILLSKKWRKRIFDTEYINERAITTTIIVNHHRIKLMSVYRCMLTITLRKMYRTNEEAHKFQKEKHTNCGRRLQCRIGPRIWSGTGQCWSAHTQREEQKRRLDEAMADDTELHSTQHDVQKKHLESKRLTDRRKGLRNKLITC